MNRKQIWSKLKVYDSDQIAQLSFYLIYTEL